MDGHLISDVGHRWGWMRVVGFVRVGFGCNSSTATQAYAERG